MKTRFRNFTRLGANFPQPSYVPEHLQRKPRWMVFWEMLQFLLAVISTPLVILSPVGQWRWLLCLLPALYLLAAICQATDNYRYRFLSSVANGFAIVLVLPFAHDVQLLHVAVLFAVMLVIFTLMMYLQKPAAAYYRFCRSNA